ncbi:MAG: HAMP domain-containing histidine kinase [Bacillus sp. (in: Bacteria)]|nr:HAMP domain-containing histidine kinase [Bacillus sp. (in: firmicutes)]
MKGFMKTKSISVKLGLLFSGVFIFLLLILGTILYGVFTNLFVDYINQDLLERGNNHANVLEGQFNQETIKHVIKMEKNVTTKVLVTDSSQRILASSVTPDQDMREHLLPKGKNLTAGLLLEEEWRQHDYIISVSPIGRNKGFVYMYYPASILREIVNVLNVLMVVVSIGIVLLAFGFIGIISKKLAQPLLMMKDATNKMSMGKYEQKIPVIGTDELAQLGRSIQSLGEQLQYYENSRNDFLASISHELRTPLTYIKGYSDILNKGMVKNIEEQREYLDIINKEATRIALLVNDLFELSKIQVGYYELEKEWTDINQIIEKVMTNLNPALIKKSLNFNVDLQETPKIYIDAKRMEQVFYNLIENAIKYTTQGEITIHSFLEKEYVIIKISDTGIGIPKIDLPKIWDRFYRVDQSRSRKTGGTGLGLYVVKKIVETHAGEITVESSENKGSTFTLFFRK